MKILFMIFLFCDFILSGFRFVLASELQGEDRQIGDDGGLVYTPGKDPSPVVVFADMDGNGKEEAVMLFRSHPRDGQGPRRRFAYVYEIEGKYDLRDRPLALSFDTCNGPPVLQQAVHDKPLEVVEATTGAKKEVHVWSSGGIFDEALFIIGVREGVVVPVFYNGCRCPSVYVPVDKTNIIHIDAVPSTM